VGGYFLRAYIAWKRVGPEPARELLTAARKALGPEWVPQGMTSEGDVRSVLHTETTPLSRFWLEWDGAMDPDVALVALDEELRRAGA
jgi:hypothetical protein